MDLVFPDWPDRVHASTLLHGADADFVINAYLALQRQWPDPGGYAHYRYILSQPGARRADVLRSIAASDNARRCGVQFIDDLPDDHDFRPEHHDVHRLVDTSMRLRLGRVARDVAELGRAVRQLATDPLSEAVAVVARAQQTHHEVLESRLVALESAVGSRRPASAGAPSPGTETGDDGPAWRHLAAQQMELQSQLQAERQKTEALRQELAELKEAFAHLHHYTTVELKRQVADYVTAFAFAERSQPTPVAPAKPAAHLRAGAPTMRRHSRTKVAPMGNHD